VPDVVGFDDDFPVIRSVPRFDDKSTLHNVGAMTAGVLEHAAQVNLVEGTIHHALQQVGAQFKFPRPPCGPLDGRQSSSLFRDMFRFCLTLRFSRGALAH
jgi:hypothetical protein